MGSKQGSSTGSSDGGVHVLYWPIYGHASEVKLNNYNAQPRSDQLKAGPDILSCTQSRNSGSSLVSKFDASLDNLAASRK